MITWDSSTVVGFVINGIALELDKIAEVQNEMKQRFPKLSSGLESNL